MKRMMLCVIGVVVVLFAGMIYAGDGAPETPKPELPKAVVDCVTAVYPNATIAPKFRVNEVGGMKHYDVIAVEGDTKATRKSNFLTVSETGVLVKLITYPPVAELPEAVVAAVKATYGEVTIEKVTRTEERVGPDLKPLDKPKFIYQVNVTQGDMRAFAIVAEDGTVLKKKGLAKPPAPKPVEKPNPVETPKPVEAPK